MQQHEPTPEAKKLYYELKKRGIACELEVYDGHKIIDLSIESAGLDIEIDGIQHFTDPDQIQSDMERSYWSQERDGFDTIHIPNAVINANLEQVANAIAKVAERRSGEQSDEEDSDDEDE